MTKAQAFVVVCAAITIASCAVSWYLVTTVNPPRLTVQSLFDERRRMMYNIENDDVVAVPFEHFQDSLAPFYRFAPTNFSKNPQKTSEKSIFILPYTVRVSPPVESPWGSVTTSRNFTETSTQGTQNPEQNISLTFNLTEPKPMPVKGYRRSIKEDFKSNIDGYSKFIILKIIDERGRARIEIKLNPDVKSQYYENENKGSSLRMQVSTNNVENSVKELGYNTEIKIMPNDNILIASHSEILDMKSTYLNNVSNENVTKLQSKMVQKLSAITDNGTESYLKEANSTNNISKEFERRLKPIHKENAKSIDKKDPNMKYLFQSKRSESDIIQNSSNAGLNDTNKMTIVSESLNKDTELKTNTMQEIILSTPTSNNTKTYNVGIETKNLSESKILYLKNYTVKKISNATKDNVKQETVNKNNTLKAETFKLRIMFDNETQSFTEPFGMREISLPSYSPQDTNNYNVKNDTKSISESKNTVETNMKNSNLTSIIEEQEIVDKNNTSKVETEKSNLRIIFDNKTKSFTETIRTKTAVESVVVAVTDKIAVI